MKKLLVLLCAIALVFNMAGSASAIPMDFDIDGLNSSVELSNITTWSVCGSSSISASLVDDLDTMDNFSLYDGESRTFDFFDIIISDATGLLSGGTADVEATLAFDKPSEVGVIGTGTGSWFNILGFISGGCLTWADMPQTITLINGDSFDVDFENVLIAGLGNTTTVSATVTAHAAPVPEPSTVMLVGTGLLGMIAFGRKKFNKKA